MNRFPAKVSYGILAILELARQDSSVPLQAKIIAKRQHIPSRFIEQILQRLKQTGLIRSIRGAHGGYTLAQDPHQINLAQLVNSLNGEVSDPPGKDGKPGEPNNGLQVSHTLLSTIWNQVQEAEQAALRVISVQSLVEQQQKLETQHGLMYHI